MTKNRLMPLFLLIAVFSQFFDQPQNCVHNKRQSPTIPSTTMFSTTYLLLRLACWSIIITLIAPLFVILLLHCLSLACVMEDTVLFIYRLWTFKTKKLLLLFLLFGFLRCTFHLRPLSSEVVSRYAVLVGHFVSYSTKLRFSNRFETELIKRYMMKNHEYGLIKRSLLISSGSVEE